MWPNSLLGTQICIVSIPFSSGRRSRRDMGLRLCGVDLMMFQSPSHRGGGAAPVENKSLPYYHFECGKFRHIRA